MEEGKPGKGADYLKKGMVVTSNMKVGTGDERNAKSDPVVAWVRPGKERNEQ